MGRRVRLALGVEYVGTRYAGWQRQDHAPSVQAELEAALSRVADHEVQVTCAGRTDAGVHATGQVVHFDTEAERELRSWVLGANANLPNDIVVRYAQRVPDTFHARYSARSRSYRYVVLNRATRPAIEAHRLAWIITPLDVARMQEAAGALLGEHDFSAFRAAQCQAKSPVRTISSFTIERHGDRVVFRVTANAFLHHMVRNLVGTLLAVGAGEQPPGWVAEVLAGRRRAQAGITAPAGGLYLVGVGYPAEFGLPSGGVGQDSAIIRSPPPCDRWPDDGGIGG